MAIVFGDRVKETSTSIGLSSFSLGGAVDSFKTFADGIGNGNQCHYVIENTTDFTWEVGIGTVSGSTLSRDSVLSSSNADLPVNFAAGTKQVFAAEAADYFNATLDLTEHAAIDHTGIPGVGGSETFTSVDHATTNHTGLPGVPAAEAFTATAHNANDHTGVTAIQPPNLAEAQTGTATTPRLWTAQRVKDAIDALGTGMELYDQAAHNADDHSGVTAIQPPSQVEAETGTATISRLWTAQRVAQAIAVQTGLQIASQFVTAVNTIIVTTSFQPLLALFVGQYVGLSRIPTIGYSIGIGASNQACSVAGSSTGTNLEGLQGSIAADLAGGVAVAVSHEVTTFSATEVRATQGTGTTAWTGFVVVFGG